MCKILISQETEMNTLQISRKKITLKVLMGKITPLTIEIRARVISRKRNIPGIQGKDHRQIRVTTPKLAEYIIRI